MKCRESIRTSTRSWRHSRTSWRCSAASIRSWSKWRHRANGPRIEGNLSTRSRRRNSPRDDATPESMNIPGRACGTLIERRPSLGSSKSLPLRDKGDDAQRRQGELRGKRLIVDLIGLRQNAAEAAHVAPAVELGVAVQGLAPETALGQPDTIIVAGHGGQVNNNQHAAGSRFILPNE